MKEKELAKALLSLDAQAIPAANDARAIAQAVLRRDRSRVRMLAGTSIALWILGALGLTIVLAAVLVVHPARQAELPDDPALREHVRLVMLEHATVVALISIGVLALAALALTLLVLASHQAALRRMSASLLDIAASLKSLEAQSE